jgi:hypothetical protein
MTTLIAWSYEACVTQRQYETEYDVVLDVLRRMPEFIGHVLPDGTPGWTSRTRPPTARTSLIAGTKTLNAPARSSPGTRKRSPTLRS